MTDPVIDVPPRPRLKHVMTATAFALVQMRTAWRSYFTALAAHRRAVIDRERRHGWGA